MTNKTCNISGLLLAIAVILVLNIPASAGTVNCTIGAVNSVTVGDPSSPDFTCGGILFDNFMLTAQDGVSGVPLTINGATENTVTGQIVLNLDPNLGANEDDWLLYEATPMDGTKINSLDLAVGGVGTSVDELACSAPIPTMGPTAYLCPAGSFLGQVSSFSGAPDVPVFSNNIGTSDPVYVYKDLGTQGIGSQNSLINQSFETGGLGLKSTPEPASLILLGGGLMLVGLLRRKRKA